MMNTKHLAFALAVTTLHFACDSNAIHESGPPTWHRDVAPILERRCLGCHAEGGSGDLRLDTYTLARDRAPLMLGAIENGSMPPWLPSDDCHPIADVRRIDAHEIDVLRAWTAASFPEGDPDTAPTVVREAFNPNETMFITNNFVPDATLEDDYRCFVLDRIFDQDTYVTASQVIPGSASVHHVLVYVILPSQLAEVAERDAADPAAGYPCFAQPVSTGFADNNAFVAYLAGGDLPNFDFPDQLGAWVPGMLPRILPDGLAYRIPAGARLVVQVHYSPRGALLPDTSRLALTTTTTTKPPALLSTRPVALLDMDVPAGATAVHSTRAYPYVAPQPLEIVGVMGHMHTLGRSIRATVLRNDGQSGEQACLLDIPAWDFHWQESYMFPTDNPVIMASGDSLELTCVHDNGPDDQAPGPDGVRPPPRDVTWGEGSRDEMCLFYHVSKIPFTPVPPPPVTPCDSASACITACGTSPQLDCLLACAEASIACKLCAVRSALQCGEFECLTVLAEASDCMATCLEAHLMLGTNLGPCLELRCPTDYTAALTCLDGPFADPDCAENLGTCGIASDP